MTFHYAAWSVLAPTPLTLWLGLIGALLLLTRRAALGRALVLISAILWVVIALAPSGYWLLHPLETRYPAREPVAGVDAIVVLTGGEQLHALHQGLAGEYGEGAERVMAGIALARRYPAAQLYLVGGIANQAGLRDVDILRRTALAMGIAPARISVVGDTRNTFENAVRATRRLRDDARRHPVLVTSAYHLPRAMLCFEATGLAPTPYPVDYRTWSATTVADTLSLGVVANMSRVDEGAHEWLGLLSYRLTGKTLRLWPSAA